MCPQTHSVSNCSVAFSLPRLYKQEAGTRTTVPSPPASTQALGRTGSGRAGESHSLVDYLVNVLVPLNSRSPYLLGVLVKGLRIAGKPQA